MAVVINAFFDTTSAMVALILLPAAMALMSGKTPSRFGGVVSVVVAFTILTCTGYVATYDHWKAVFDFRARQEMLSATISPICPYRGDSSVGSDGESLPHIVSLVQGQNTGIRWMTHTLSTWSQKAGLKFVSSANATAFACDIDVFQMETTFPGVLLHFPRPYRSIIAVRDPRLALLEESKLACQRHSPAMGASEDLDIFLKHNTTDVPTEVCKDGTQAALKYIIQNMPKGITTLHSNSARSPDPQTECTGPLEYVCAVHGLQGYEDVLVVRGEEMFADPDEAWFTIATFFQLRGNVWKSLVEGATKLTSSIAAVNSRTRAGYELVYSKNWHAEFGEENMKLFNEALGHTLPLLGYEK